MDKTNTFLSILTSHRHKGLFQNFNRLPIYIINISIQLQF